jgi:hypothetical protein
MAIGIRCWETLAAFYDKDPSRRKSNKSRFGDDWREEAQRLDASWQVAFVHNTHELVAKRAVHGRLDDLDTGPVVLLGTFPTPALADAALDGWDRLEPRTLEWAARRAEIGQVVYSVLAALSSPAV